MDVMKYGAECEVVGRDELRREVGERVLAAGRVYAIGGDAVGVILSLT